MQFTQLQARAAAALSVETLRHWRKVIPYLDARKGRQAKFSFGDLVVLTALRYLIDELGLGISQFAVSGEGFFKECNGLAWIESTGAYALINSHPELSRTRSGRRELGAVTVEIVREDLATKVTRPTIVMPLDPLANSLRVSLFGTGSRSTLDQPWLPLPLTPVPAGPRRNLGSDRRR